MLASQVVYSRSCALTLSIFCSCHGTKKPFVQTAPVSGTESDSDSVFSPELASPSPILPPSLSGNMMGTSASHPLSSIAERRSASGGEESEEEDDGWRVETEGTQREALHDTVLKTGYLWKKGERRKVRVLCPSAQCMWSDVCRTLSSVLDMEEAVVRPASRPPGVL